MTGTGDVGGIEQERLTAKMFDVKETLVENDIKLVKIAVTETVKTTAPPISTDTNVANTITVNISDHEYNVGDTLVVAGSAAVGGVAANSINGTKTVASIKDNNAVNVTVSDSVSSTVTHGGGNNVTIDGSAPLTPFISTTSGSATLTLYQTTHGLSAGDSIIIIGASAVDGVPATAINKNHIVISVPDVNRFTVLSSVVATSTEKGGGAYSYVEIPVKATSAARGGTLNTTINGIVTNPGRINMNPHTL